MIIVPEEINTHNALGRWGEEYVWRECRKAGLDVKVALDGGDLVVNGLRIEVKTASQGHDLRYRFCLCKEGCTDHRRAEIIVLLAVANSGLVTVFVVPIEALTLKDNITLPKLRGYKGKYVEYRKPLVKGLARWIH